MSSRSEPGGVGDKRQRRGSNRSLVNNRFPGRLNFAKEFPRLSRKSTAFALRYRPMRQFQSRTRGEAMKIGTFVCAAAITLSALPAIAEPVELAGDELRNAVSGKTVFLNVSGFELPI